jgi:hypothetical protein
LGKCCDDLWQLYDQTNSVLKYLNQQFGLPDDVDASVAMQQINGLKEQFDAQSKLLKRKSDKARELSYGLNQERNEVDRWMIHELEGGEDDASELRKKGGMLSKRLYCSHQ